jgi:hypothetical protein
MIDTILDRTILVGYTRVGYTSGYGPTECEHLSGWHETPTPAGSDR